MARKKPLLVPWFCGIGRGWGGSKNRSVARVVSKRQRPSKQQRADSGRWIRLHCVALHAGRRTLHHDIGVVLGEMDWKELPSTPLRQHGLQLGVEPKPLQH